ncbi:response regulator transcription factor [Mucilaginibacter panaciglaebae]
MMRIIVVDDHPVVRNGLCQLLGGQDDIEILASAADGDATLALLKSGIQANMVLTDLNMRGMDGWELTRQLTALNPALFVIILTLHPQIAVKQRALAAGAKDCLSKDGDIDELLSALRAAHASRAEI